MLAVMHHLMGVHEIAERLGVSRQYVHQKLTTRADFPAPDHHLKMGKVWKTEDIETWITKYRPKDARPVDDV